MRRTLIAAAEAGAGPLGALADGAAVDVVVHEAHGLHEGVGGRRADEGPAALLEVLAEARSTRASSASSAGAGQVRRFGRSVARGSKDQKKRGERALLPASSRARRALLIVDSILPRWRTIPASFSRRATSRAPKRATASTSNPRKAARKLSRLRRMVSQLRPAWKPSRQIFSKSRAVVGDGEAPLLVVIARVEGVAARPEAADDAVLAPAEPSASRAMVALPQPPATRAPAPRGRP